MRNRQFTNEAFKIMLLIYAACIGIAYLCVIGV